MRAWPQRTHRKPRYPTRLEIDADPELLRRHLPAGWAASPKLASAAALLLSLALPGCTTPPSAGPTPPTAAAGAKPTLASEPSNAVAIVAPLFDHGEGRSWFGCVIVTPPVYLSEDEAWQVIDLELAKRGIKLTEKEHLIPGVAIPLYPTAELEALKEGDPLPKPSSIEPLKADRADPQRKIVLEFVSADNPPEKAQPWSLGSIYGLKLKGEAEALRQEVAASAHERIYFGALYDPVTIADVTSDKSPRPPVNRTPADWDKYWDRVNAPAKAESKRLLRLQVQEFIQWLQAQGAI